MGGARKSAEWRERDNLPQVLIHGRLTSSYPSWRPSIFTSPEFCCIFINCRNLPLISEITCFIVEKSGNCGLPIPTLITGRHQEACECLLSSEGVLAIAILSAVVHCVRSSPALWRANWKDMPVTSVDSILVGCRLFAGLSGWPSVCRWVLLRIQSFCFREMHAPAPRFYEDTVACYDSM